MPRYWSDAHRQAASMRAKLHRPSDHSTGPRTAEGKRISSRNSYKHGRYTHERKILGWYTRLAALRVKQLRTRLNLEYKNYQNELIEKWGLPKSFKPDRRAFYPYFAVHPLDFKKNGKK